MSLAGIPAHVVSEPETTAPDDHLRSLHGALYCTHERASTISPPKLATAPSPKDTRFTRPFIQVVLAHFMQALGCSSMLLLPIYIKHLGSTEAQLGTIMAIASVGGLLFRPLVGWSLD